MRWSAPIPQKWQNRQFQEDIERVACLAPLRSCPCLQPFDFAGIHPGEPKALASKVLQRCPDEVQLLVVDDEETVVERRAGLYAQSRILLVELRDVAGRQLVAARKDLTLYQTDIITSKL